MNEDKNELARIIAIAVIAVTVIAAITGAIIYDNSRKSKPVVMTQQEATTPETVAKRVNVTPVESRIITREIERSADTPPGCHILCPSPDRGEGRYRNIGHNKKAVTEPPGGCY